MKKTHAVILVPAGTKRRAERVAKYYGKPITYFVETAAPIFEEAVLRRLPDDACRALCLRRKLKLEHAFPGKGPVSRRYLISDPAEGPHEAISVNLSPRAALQFARYRALLGVTMGFVAAKLFKNFEKGILDRTSNAERARVFSGQWEPTAPPLTIDPFNIEEDEASDL